MTERSRMICLRLILLLVCGLASVAPRSAFAQESELPVETQQSDSTEAAASPLLSRQQQVAERFRELERLMLRMAELTAPTDPRRAALLRQAVAQSKQRAIDDQFDALLELLKQERLSAAVKGQGEVQGDLVRLLELLLSEDRSKRIESEKERIREYLKRVNQIIKEQKSVQNATQRDGDSQELADRQGDLSDKTGKLADDLREEKSPSTPSDRDPADRDAEGQRPKSPESDDQKPDGDQRDGQSGDGQPGEGAAEKGDGSDADKDARQDSQSKPSDADAEKSTDGEPSEGDPADGKPSDSESPSGDSPSEVPPVEPPADGQQQPGEPGDQSPSDSSPPDPQQSPAQQRLEKAQQRMQEAQKKLEEAQREDAAARQEEALRELEQAKAELEEILRQLREEEMARTLAMLEARFRKMLDAQVLIYEGTQRLDRVPEAERDRDDEIEAGRLSRKEAELVVEADKALTLLREEGSAVAFPEAVQEIRDDMLTVRDRLAESKVGEMTQGIEQDIIAALEEMITALEKAQKDLQDQQQQPPPPMQAGGDNEMPLVDTLSELKMIRALQMRVNTRTQRYAEMTKTEQVDQPELLQALRQLAEREQRIHKVTRDIVLGRNR